MLFPGITTVYEGVTEAPPTEEYNNNLHEYLRPCEYSFIGQLIADGRGIDISDFNATDFYLNNPEAQNLIRYIQQRGVTIDSLDEWLRAELGVLVGLVSDTVNATILPNPLDRKRLSIISTR